jgi:hypothetical protein
LPIATPDVASAFELADGASEIESVILDLGLRIDSL